jgi:hypothetical protein
MVQYTELYVQPKEVFYQIRLDYDAFLYPAYNTAQLRFLVEGFLALAVGFASTFATTLDFF